MAENGSMVGIIGYCGDGMEMGREGGVSWELKNSVWG